MKQYTVEYSSREQRTQNPLALCGREPLLDMVQSTLILFRESICEQEFSFWLFWKLQSIQGISTHGGELPICIVDVTLREMTSGMLSPLTWKGFMED